MFRTASELTTPKPSNAPHAASAAMQVSTTTSIADHVDSTVSTSSTTESMPPSHLKSTCAGLHARVAKFLAEDTSDELLKEVQKQTRIALHVIDEALTRYGLEHLSFSYNGGKDCLVLLILYLVAIYTHYDRQSRTPSTPPSTTLPPAQPFPSTLRSIYIISPNPFPQVDVFVQSSSIQYNLSLFSSSLPMKAAFGAYVEHNADVQAIFVGTRRTDPHGADLTHFDPTDRGWPSFMRIHPVIDWHYREIWGFIRHFEIPYCELYDMGYTSLGGTTDTHPNPALRAEVQGEGADTGYRPAYELVEDDEERLGRDH